MSIQQLLLGASGASGYNLERSLRFRASASAYLNRTYVAAPTDYRKFTFSAWVKLGALGVSRRLLDAGFGSDTGLLNIGTDGSLNFAIVTAGAATDYLKTNNLLRDPSAWYHIVFTCDTSVGSNQFKYYINGVQASYSINSSIITNYGTGLNSALASAQLGRSATYAQHFDGYMAEVNFIDGQALTPSSFGSTNALTGVWQPARYTGTYGTNGFYLPFTDNSALTTSSNVGLGRDYSGNGNYWATNNISITAGVTYDSMTDVPTLTSATVNNCCVLNPNELTQSGTLISGNLQVANCSSWSASKSTIAMPSGKWYAEVTVNFVNFCEIGIFQTDKTLPAAGGFGYPGYSPFGYCLLSFSSNSQLDNNNGQSNYGSGVTAGDILMMAYDAVNGKCYFGKNGTWFGSSNPATQTNPPIIVSASTQYSWVVANNGNNAGVSANFGQRPFTYTPPTGFVALNTFNLPASTIVKGNTVMDATLYTGTLLSNAITNSGGFQPDLVWIKGRSAATEHKESNSVRGVTKATKPNSTDPETTDPQGITAFNANGFTVGTDTNYNNLAATYVGWQWKGGGAASSNTSGTITSQVSVNAAAGFSLLTFNGTGANATVGHGLGVTPSMFIVKNLTNAAGNWAIGHTGLTSFSGNAIYLNSTAAQFSAGTFWNSLAPTSSVINLGSSPQINEFAQPLMAQVWAAIAGYSSFGTYTGNGSTDGTFVYTGFRPKVIWIKSRDGATGWRQYDTTRSPANLTNLYLQSSSSAAEQSSGASIDILSNGFKIRDSDAGVNGSGSTYIYACWAENPFKNSLAR
jgi:hypothetical protein